MQIAEACAAPERTRADLCDQIGYAECQEGGAAAEGIWAYRVDAGREAQFLHGSALTGWCSRSRGNRQHGVSFVPHSNAARQLGSAQGNADLRPE